MDFSLEEAFDILLDLILMSGAVGVLIYFFLNVHNYT